MAFTHYTKSLPYELELTSRIMHEAINVFFKENNFVITHDEFVVLDTLYTNPGILQIDLAKLILKGRAHTGRFLMSLEKKGYVLRIPSTKGQKLIMLNSLTDEGKKIHKEISNAIKRHIKNINTEFNENINEEIINLLHIVRNEVLSKCNIKFN